MNALTECHMTQNKIPFMDGALVANKTDGSWHFTTIEAADSVSDYGFACKRVFGSPEATISWIAHLTTKPWFNSEKFTKFMHDFAHKNGIAKIF